MSRLFAMSHREVYDLMMRWGFEPERVSGGHQIMRHHNTGRRVQIMPPDRTGTGELGNAKAMKKAARMLNIHINKFLAGPTVPEKPKSVEPPLEVVVPEPKESAVTATNWPENKGYSDAIEQYLKDHADKKVHVSKIIGYMAGKFPDCSPKSAASLPAQLVVQKKRPNVVRAGRGLYMWTSNPPQAKVSPVSAPPVDSVTDETPRDQYVKSTLEREAEASVALDGETQNLGAPSTPRYETISTVNTSKAPTLNGSSPDLLSKLAPLQNGKYLFEGDDGAIYIVDGLRKLDA